jgi:hypothetical protein
MSSSAFAREERLRFVDFQFNTEPNGRCRAEVTLGFGAEMRWRGTADGLASDAGEMRCAAEATLHAIEASANGAITFELLGVGGAGVRHDQRPGRWCRARAARRTGWLGRPRPAAHDVARPRYQRHEPRHGKHLRPGALVTSRATIVSLLALLAIAAACARPVEGPAPIPVAAAPDTAPPAANPAEVAQALAAATDDSAADRAVLEALAELEFGSLDRRAGRVRGQADGGTELSRTDLEGESALLFESEGGPDAAAAVVRHLDVESFARHSRVQYYIDFFRGEARDRFTIWLGRLPRYEGMIREQLRRYGVPEDLVYLAMIESGYSNTAVSRAKAVGMWQFIASTGRQYGLSQDVGRPAP